MGAEAPQAKAIDPSERHRPGLAYPNPLAGNPGAPRFGQTVKTAAGTSLTLADPIITRVALACMNMNAVHGGAACHWGGPSGLAEIMSAIHGLMFARDPWLDHFNFGNDAGHTENGVYALKANYGYAGLDFASLKGFRSIGSKLTGHGESHLFADGVMISNGPLGSSLPICQGLAMADRVADKQRTTVCVVSDGAAMEGEAKESLAAIPGFAAKGELAPFVLLIPENNTKLSGRIDADSFSMLPTFEALDDLGWKVVVVENGHDLQVVFSSIESAVTAAKADPTKPVAIWFKTIKGYGVKSTEASASGGHGYPLKHGGQVRVFVEEIVANAGRSMADLDPLFPAWIEELEATHAAMEAAKAAKGGATKKAPSDKVQSGFPKAMIAAAKQGLPVVCISADLPGSTGLAPFHAEYPQFSFDVGIAESNMVSVASGFSKQGYIPVVDTFAQFGVTKGLLPLCMGVLSQSPCIAVFTHAGFQDAADGASHQALMYLAMTAAIPDVEQYVPICAEEAEWAMDHAIRRFAADRAVGRHPKTVVFFCGRENFPLSYRTDGVAYAWGKAQVVLDTTAGTTSTVAISATGSLVAHAMTAARILAAAGIGAVVLNNATPNHPDIAAHAAALATCGGRLITVEEHQVIGGAGGMLKAALLDAGVACRVRSLGVQGEFGRSAYTATELYNHYGIGASAIADAARALV